MHCALHITVVHCYMCGENVKKKNMNSTNSSRVCIFSDSNARKKTLQPPNLGQFCKQLNNYRSNKSPDTPRRAGTSRILTRICRIFYAPCQYQ